MFAYVKENDNKTMYGIFRDVWKQPITPAVVCKS